MGWDDGLINSMAKKEKPNQTGRVLTYAQAIHEALEVALERDPNIFILGQGVDDPSGYWGVTKDLHKKFGGKRVFDTPLSEEGMTGVCVGAAMTGKRPILFHNRPDFILLSFNQLVSHAAKMSFMDNGHSKVPMVIWSAIGRGWGSGAQHSQTVHGMLMGVPNLKIVMPSTPYDAKGLLLTALEEDNPVLIFEHRWTMRYSGVVPEGHYKVGFGKGIFRKKGTTLTIVGTSHTLDVALQAVNKLGISADVIDLRTIKPLDEDIIEGSLIKTGKLLIVDTGPRISGVCAEIAAIAAEKWIHLLKGPVRRIGMPDIPHPAGYSLEQMVYPSIESISAVIKKMVN